MRFHSIIHEWLKEWTYQCYRLKKSHFLPGFCFCKWKIREKNLNKKRSPCIPSPFNSSITHAHWMVHSIWCYRVTKSNMETGKRVCIQYAIANLLQVFLFLLASPNLATLLAFFGTIILDSIEQSCSTLHIYIYIYSRQNRFTEIGMTGKKQSEFQNKYKLQFAIGNFVSLGKMAIFYGERRANYFLSSPSNICEWTRVACCYPDLRNKCLSTPTLLYVALFLCLLYKFLNLKLSLVSKSHIHHGLQLAISSEISKIAFLYFSVSSAIENRVFHK